MSSLRVFAASVPLLWVRSWLHLFQKSNAIRDEGVIYVTGRPLLNRRYTRLLEWICLQNDQFCHCCVGWGIKLWSRFLCWHWVGRHWSVEHPNVPFLKMRRPRIVLNLVRSNQTSEEVKSWQKLLKRLLRVEELIAILLLIDCGLSAWKTIAAGTPKMFRVSV